MMDDVQRVTGFVHVNTGQCPPGAAYQVKRLPVRLRQPVQSFKLALNRLPAFPNGLPAVSAHRAQRQRNTLGHAPVVQKRQFQTGAAEIGHNAASQGDCAEDSAG